MSIGHDLIHVESKFGVKMNGVGFNKNQFSIFKKIFLILSLTWSISAFPKEFTFPLHFDFGAKNSKVKSGALLITDYSLYDHKKGYGLTKYADTSFRLDDESLKDDMTIDGVSSKDSLQFRVDISSGDYWIEMFMQGGNRSLWVGEIRANHTVIVDSIFQYVVSFEGEDPPIYWTLFRKVTVTGNALLLSIHALNQNSTLTGISIYKDDVGPLRLIKGEIVPENSFSAPNATLAIHLINRGATREAQRVIDQIPEEQFRYEKALLLLALAGRLEISDPRLYVDLAGKLLEIEFATDPRPDVALNLRLAQLYTLGDMYYKMGGWEWARVYTGQGIFARLNIAGHLIQKIFEVSNHPLYQCSAFYLGRLSFHAWVEQHDKWQKIRADRYFNYLKIYYPNFRLLKIYLDEQILAEAADTSAYSVVTPEWVNQTHLAMTSLRDVIHYWVDNRQADNGEFGGKYDDDVEMLRWWPITRLANNDSKTLLGMRRLVDGVWNSGWITDGFSSKVRDVEHSSEPVADTQPMMIALDYGNPIYVERCMESIKGLRELWTGVNKYGHRHFKSSWYSYNQIDARPPRNCDVEMNARTVSAARWLAWYNRHPFAMQFIREWSDAWLEDCMRTDKGKPYGIVPAAIRYEDDAIGGHADNWHHPGMFWDYYNFHGGTRMMKQFLATYQLTDDVKYLAPIEEALKLAEKYYHQNTDQAAIGSEAWVAEILKRSSDFDETVELWRLLTGNSKYDRIISQIGSDYLKFRLTGDKTCLAVGSKRVSDGILYNRELRTTEGYFTDRIAIGNINESKLIGSNHLESMFTGNSLHEGFYPFFIVSWEGMGDAFVAVVVNATPQSIEMLAYNLTTDDKKGLIYFWALEPGTYQFLQGEDKDDNGEFEKILQPDTFSVINNNAVHSLKMPHHSLQRIKIRNIKESSQNKAVNFADLAVVDTEVRVKKDASGKLLIVSAPVHNIGIADAEDVSVQLSQNIRGKEKAIAREKIKKISAPLDLEPRIVNIDFEIEATEIETGTLIIHVDPQNQVSEITKINNRITIKL